MFLCHWFFYSLLLGINFTCSLKQWPPFFLLGVINNSVFVLQKQTAAEASCRFAAAVDVMERRALIKHTPSAVDLWVYVIAVLSGVALKAGPARVDFATALTMNGACLCSVGSSLLWR